VHHHQPLNEFQNRPFDASRNRPFLATYGSAFRSRNSKIYNPLQSLLQAAGNELSDEEKNSIHIGAQQIVPPGRV
jgi:hypothetical protein